MKFNRVSAEFDATDRGILELLQENCKRPLAEIGEKVGLTAPSVFERIHKLEEAGVITAYVALLDARRLGKDVTAFIGVSTDPPRAIGTVERQVSAMEEILECHHVTGGYTLLIKAKTRNTEALESLVEQIRSIHGVSRTETMVVFSTSTERLRIALDSSERFTSRPARRAGGGRGRRGEASGARRNGR